MDRKEAKATTIELLTQVGIPSPAERAKAYPGQLSGGMRQRGRHGDCTRLRPPSAHGRRAHTGLDVTVQAQILDLLGSLQAERHMAVILVTHDLGVVPLVPTRSPSCMRSHRREGTDQDTLRRHGHAYTAALLASTPRLSEPSHSRLAAIDGRPPDLLNPARAVPSHRAVPMRRIAAGSSARPWSRPTSLATPTPAGTARWPRASRRPGEPDQRPCR